MQRYEKKRNRGAPARKKTWFPGWEPCCLTGGMQMTLQVGFSSDDKDLVDIPFRYRRR